MKLKIGKESNLSEDNVKKTYCFVLKNKFNIKWLTQIFNPNNKILKKEEENDPIITKLGAREYF